MLQAWNRSKERSHWFSRNALETVYINTWRLLNTTEHHRDDALHENDDLTTLYPGFVSDDWIWQWRSSYTLHPTPCYSEKGVVAATKTGCRGSYQATTYSESLIPFSQTFGNGRLFPSSVAIEWRKFQCSETDGAECILDSVDVHKSRIYSLLGL